MIRVKGKGFTGDFDWRLYPDTEKFLQGQISRFLHSNNFTKKLSTLMWNKTSTRILDWIDHIVLPTQRIKPKFLTKLGYKEMKIDSPSNSKVFKHPRAILFPILLTDSGIMEIALKPENIDHFVSKLRKKVKINGKKLAPYRRAEINKQGKYLLTAIERRGTSAFAVLNNVNDIDTYKKAFKTFSIRKRKFETDRKGVMEVNELVKSVLKKLSPERTADAFFRNERIYWEKRNKAGRIQKKRQNILGLGWGNHDHHTYRSSRENFKHLVNIFENLGFFCRERFFAGEKAGWGAQILEHPECDIVIFSDVDITKNEKNTDFAHKGLKNNDSLRTVGLWVGLHGESILQAGMHHLEARFDFEKLKKDLIRYKINVMPPFSNFSFLKQAFTIGERWKVNKSRLDYLLRREMITKAQYPKFMKEGAIGSHLENLQRKQGFKGFNQDSVTAIIKAIDPRNQFTIGA